VGGGLLLELLRTFMALEGEKENSKLSNDMRILIILFIDNNILTN
jgi:hypothetical protein